MFWQGDLCSLLQAAIFGLYLLGATAGLRAAAIWWDERHDDGEVSVE